MSNKPLDEDSVRRAFQRAREIVLAYGPEDLPWSVRTALCEMLTHYENAALADKPEAASEIAEQNRERERPKCDCGHFDAATVEKQVRVIADLTAQLARCREDTVEECAKAICSLCRDGVPLETEITHTDFRGFHKLGIASDGLDDYEDCEAAPFRALAPTTGDGR